jgi:hypothetical protein
VATLYTAKSTSAVFDDPNLVGSAGLVPVMRLAARAGLAALADRLLSVPSDKGANAGVKVASLVAGMVAGADSIDDMAVLRHGGMSRLFSRIYAPSTLGSFLRTFRFGRVRQLDGVAARFFHELSNLTPVLNPSAVASSPGFCIRRCRRQRDDRRARPRQADIPWPNWSSCREVFVVLPGGCFVVEGSRFQAAVQDTNEAVGELAQRGPMPDAARPEGVVVGMCPRRCA